MNSITQKMIEALSLAELVKLAVKLQVFCDVESWLDDDYPAKEDKLRIEVAQKLLEAI